MTTDLSTFAKEEGIKYFMISFTDLFGGQRAKLVPARAISDMQEDGAGFAGFATYLLAQSIGLAPDFGLLLALTPPVLLLTSLPISFGGWGPREAGLIWLFGLFGIAAAPALAVSVALGVLVMIAGLPGGALWFSRLARRSPTG